MYDVVATFSDYPVEPKERSQVVYGVDFTPEAGEHVDLRIQRLSRFNQAAFILAGRPGYQRNTVAGSVQTFDCGQDVLRRAAHGESGDNEEKIGHSQPDQWAVSEVQVRLFFLFRGSRLGTPDPSALPRKRRRQSRG